jgi:hypothetical protein
MFKMSTTHSLKSAFVASVIALALAGCQAADTGPSSTEDRPVGAFQAVEMEGAAQLDILVGPAASVSITGSQAARAAFNSRVEGDRLLLTSNGSAWKPNLGKIMVRVTVPQLRALKISGAGEISVNGINGDSLDVAFDGASSLEASGTIGKLAVQMNGAGKMDLSRLQAVDATVTANGAGSIDVNSTGSLDATVNGVGSINYYGKPAKVTSAINGVGSIAPRTRDH